MDQRGTNPNGANLSQSEENIILSVQKRDKEPPASSSIEACLSSAPPNNQEKGSSGSHHLLSATMIQFPINCLCGSSFLISSGEVGTKNITPNLPFCLTTCVRQRVFELLLAVFSPSSSGSARDADGITSVLTDFEQLSH